MTSGRVIPFGWRPGVSTSGNNIGDQEVRHCANAIAALSILWVLSPTNACSQNRQKSTDQLTGWLTKFCLEDSKKVDIGEYIQPVWWEFELFKVLTNTNFFDFFNALQNLGKCPKYFSLLSNYTLCLLVKLKLKEEKVCITYPKAPSLQRDFQFGDLGHNMVLIRCILTVILVKPELP